MDNEKRCAVVSGFENDGEFLVVEYTQEDGQRVKAGFERVLWIRGSKEVNEETKAILARGPEFVISGQGRPYASLAQQAKPRRQPKPRSNQEPPCHE